MVTRPLYRLESVPQGSPGEGHKTSMVSPKEEVAQVCDLFKSQKNSSKNFFCKVENTFGFIFF